MVVFKRMAWVVAILVGLSPCVSLAASIDGKWFLHPFGEMRAYFSDFLAVCDGEDFKSCRVVQYGFGPDVEGNQVDAPDGFFGNSRLSIRLEISENNDPIYSIEVFSTKLPSTPKGPILLSIDGKVFQLSENDWQAGSPEGYNVAQSFSIVEPMLGAKLIAAMKSGNRLRVLHDGWTETQFQLRGITRAINAIKLR